MASPVVPPLRVIVTRPRAQASSFVQALQQDGIDAVALPLIDICPVADVQPLRQAWAELPEQALVMFVSANAVQALMAQRPAGCACTSSPSTWCAHPTAAGRC